MVQGHDLPGREGQVEIAGPSRRRLQANRECLTSCNDDSNINTGRSMSCPSGIGWHEAYMLIDWRSRRSSLSQRKSGTLTSAFYAGVAKGGRF